MQDGDTVGFVSNMMIRIILKRKALGIIILYVIRNIERSCMPNVNLTNNP